MSEDLSPAAISTEQLLSAFRGSLNGGAVGNDYLDALADIWMAHPPNAALASRIAGGDKTLAAGVDEILRGVLIDGFLLGMQAGTMGATIAMTGLLKKP